jgi:Family of unknown function (DUF6011)
MKCGFCKTADVGIAHVKECAKLPKGATKVAVADQFDKSQVPTGRYALSLPFDEFEFFQVDRPDKGKWSGFTFVRKLIGTGYAADYRKVNVRGAEAEAALRAIWKDPERFMIQFGKLSGKCGKCGAPLSDPESLELGIGPICAKNYGFKVAQKV